MSTLQSEAMELADFTAHIPREEPVSLKLNPGWDKFISAAWDAMLRQQVMESSPYAPQWTTAN